MYNVKILRRLYTVTISKNSRYKNITKHSLAALSTNKQVLRLETLFQVFPHTFTLSIIPKQIARNVCKNNEPNRREFRHKARFSTLVPLLFLKFIYRILKDECNGDLAVNIFRRKDTKILEHFVQLAGPVNSELAADKTSVGIINVSVAVKR